MLRIDTRACGIFGSRVLCAVSGGADSVCLLRLLIEKRDAGEIELAAAHFEHGIRGEESVSDMEFVKALCAEFDVPLVTGSANVPEEAKQHREGIEECARRLRHAFLEKERVRQHCDVIALAHHSRDRAETVLMHLLRGSGLSGAAAMPMQDGALVRPLINVSPDEIREYLTGISQPFREDATNFVPDNPRNALRLKVLPLMREIYPGCEQALGRFAEIAEGENELMERLTDEFEKQYVKPFAGITVIGAGGENALRRRVIRRHLPSSLGYESILAAENAMGYMDLGSGWRVYGADGCIYLLPPLTDPGETPLPIDGDAVLDGVCRVSVSPAPNEPIRENGCVQVLDGSALTGAVLRLRRDGDFIRPFGMGGKKKLLSDYLIDRKVPLPLRERLPVLANQNEILWVPGQGISERARLTPSSAAVRIELQISEETPL